MLFLGLLKLPISKSLPTSPNTSTDIIPVVSSEFPGSVSSNSVLSMDHGSNSLPAANLAYLKELPPMKTFPHINPSAKNWFDLVTAQGLKSR